VNGVTTVVQRIARLLRAAGHAAAVVAPRYPDRLDAEEGGGDDELRIPSLPFPPYPSVRLSLPFGHRVDEYLARFAPNLVHVHTEGPLGTIGRRWAMRAGVPLVTTFHTHFPQYARYYGLPALEPLVWRWLTWFHRPARLTHTPGEFIREELVARGVTRAMVWGRGVDTTLFHPGRRDPPGARAYAPMTTRWSCCTSADWRGKRTWTSCSRRGAWGTPRSAPAWCG
jgi:glycosyltransferase involved in cell wall biosynthesis